MAQPGERRTRTALKALKIVPAQAAPHLTCIDATAELRIIARDHWNNGIRHRGAAWRPAAGKW